VHRANEALKQLGFAFLSSLEQGARSLSVFNFGRSFRQALLVCSMLQQNERSLVLPVKLTSSEMV